MREHWKSIEGFPGYEVSDRGAVYCARLGRRLRQPHDSYGYCIVGLRGPDGKFRTKKVHRLVLAAFAGHRASSTQCRHLNGVRDDNRWPENLAWGTILDNGADARRHGSQRGSRNGNSRLTEFQVRCLRALAIQHVPHRLLAQLFKVSVAMVSCITAGRNWRHVEA